MYVCIYIYIHTHGEFQGVTTKCNYGWNKSSIWGSRQLGYGAADSLHDSCFVGGFTMIFLGFLSWEAWWVNQLKDRRGWRRVLGTFGHCSTWYGWIMLKTSGWSTKSGINSFTWKTTIRSNDIDKTSPLWTCGAFFGFHMALTCRTPQFSLGKTCQETLYPLSSHPSDCMRPKHPKTSKNIKQLGILNLPTCRHVGTFWIMWISLVSVVETRTLWVGPGFNTYYQILSMFQESEQGDHLSALPYLWDSLPKNSKNGLTWGATTALHQLWPIMAQKSSETCEITGNPGPFSRWNSLWERDCLLVCKGYTTY